MNCWLHVTISLFCMIAVVSLYFTISKIKVGSLQKFPMFNLTFEENNEICFVVNACVWQLNLEVWLLQSHEITPICRALLNVNGGVFTVWLIRAEENKEVGGHRYV